MKAKVQDEILNVDEPAPSQDDVPPKATEHEFGFPFPPYDIQLKLMKVAYDSYEYQKFALLESPTGTGKSLSLICSALSWLQDHKANLKERLLSRKEALSSRVERLKEEEESSADWLSAQTKRQEVTRELEKVTKELEHIQEFDQRSEARRHAKLHGNPLENYAALTVNDSIINKTLDNTLNVTCDENNLITNSGSMNQTSLFDVTVHGDDDNEDLEKSIKAQKEDDHVKPKIFYASRTHSQLSQFINEVKRTRFANIDLNVPIKVTSLASRANLCVNPEVLKLRDPSAINERCMEMQKETKPENRCPFIKSRQLNKLKDDILTTVHDIEDLVSRGRSQGSCPYYATRLAIPEAELIVLPYNNLLHRETRQASSLDLKENIVIVDEAHNILETICSIHSAPLNGLQLVGSHTILSRYYAKYHTRMSPRNASMVKTVVQCITTLIKYLSDPGRHIKEYECPKSVDLDNEDAQRSVNQSSDTKLTLNSSGKICKPQPKHQEFMIDVGKFIGASNIERFNVFKIIDYFQRSQLARKLLGFFRQDPSVDLDIELHRMHIDNCDPKSEEQAEAKSPIKKRRKTQENKKSNTSNKVKPNLAEGQKWEFTSLSFLKDSIKTSLIRNKNQNLEITTYPIYTMIEFLRSLTNLPDDGKILTDYRENDLLCSSLRFILLNPSSQFKQMTQEARSIVLAGGTMQPFNEFSDLLFGPLGVDEGRLKFFSCGHVINKDHLHVVSLTTGPSAKPLELSYKVKGSSENIDEIGRAIMNISTIAPSGMVCFLPSYEYEQLCFNRWTQTGIISKIESRSKQVFREPRQASHLRSILDEYSRVIEKGETTGRGALLFCVVGGKMSEGINFNDHLGRCVVMVGLPYANIKSSELQQKMLYYDRTCGRASGGAPGAGQQYYENLCIKGINQSIGRAIRHKEDYAAIVLLDRRYSTKNNIKMGLPEWIRQSLHEYDRFGPMFSQLKTFYNSMQKRQATSRW